MQKLILYLFALIYFSNVQAQHSLSPQLQQAKFEIIKKSLEFLSTDTLFKKVRNKSCVNCKTYEDLQKFVADNELINAHTKLIKPLAGTSIDTAADKWKNSLSAFNMLAINLIAGPGKERRKNLPDYKNYENALTEISNHVTAQETPLVTSVAEPNMPVADTPSVKAPVEATASTGMMQWVPYGIAAVLLGLVVFALMENSKNKKKVDELTNINDDLRNIQQTANADVQKLKKKISELEQQLQDKELDLQSYEYQLNQERKKEEAPAENLLVLQPAASPIDNTKTTPATKETQPKAPASITKYSRYADLGDGFSTIELLDEADNKTIFELTISPNNTGTYKIVSNPIGQKYAISNAQYFLEKTCHYDTFPGNNTRIQTDEPGLIKLNSGKWIITNPARISFS